MRVFLICKRFYTNRDLFKDRFGRLYHLPKQLMNRGARVEVAAIDYRNKESEQIDEDGLVFKSIPATYAKLLLLPYLLYRNALAAKPDIIIASGDSHIGFIAMLLAKMMGIPFVFDVYDYYPAFQGNRIPGMKTMFNLSVRAANMVLCASDPLLQKISPLNAKGLLIENGVDRGLFAPSNIIKARRELGLDPELLLVGYFGSINPSRGPLLIEACRILRDESPMFHLVLAGHINGVDLNFDWITYLGEVPQSTLPRVINSCNVVTIPYVKTLFNDMCGACKIAEYFACGKPVVATRVSAHERIFKDAPGSLCEPTPHSLAEAIKRQIVKPEVVAFPDDMSWRHIGGKLYQSLQSLS